MSMQVIARTQSVRISPRKVRLVADAIKRMPVDEALRALSLTANRPAAVLEKTIKSALANAVHNAQLEEKNMVIDRIEITESQALKRFHPSTRGRVHPYKKRGSHIRVTLSEKIIVTKPVVAKKEKIEKTEKIEKKAKEETK